MSNATHCNCKLYYAHRRYSGRMYLYLEHKTISVSIRDNEQIRAKQGKYSPTRVTKHVELLARGSTSDPYRPALPCMPNESPVHRYVTDLKYARRDTSKK